MNDQTADIPSPQTFIFVLNITYKEDLWSKTYLNPSDIPRIYAYNKYGENLNQANKRKLL